MRIPAYVLTYKLWIKFQLGGVLGCVLPNLFVPQSLDKEEVARGMQLMHYFYLAYALVTIILNVICKLAWYMYMYMYRALSGSLPAVFVII